MAFMDSGIAMHHLYAAVSCAVTENEDIILNPDELQINVSLTNRKLNFLIQTYIFTFQSSTAYFTLVFTNSETRQLLTSHTTGEFSHSTYLHCMDKCYAASKEIINFYNRVIKKSSALCN